MLSATADATSLPIMAIGDSVMLAANPGLKKQFPGILVDAHVSRSPADVFLRIKQRAAAGGLRPVVVIGAGTNGPIQPADLTAILQYLKDRSVVVLVTCRADRAWIAQSNAAIAAANQQFGPGKGNVRVADWQSFSAGHRDWLYADGIHPKPPTGPAEYAALIQQTLKGSAA